MLKINEPQKKYLGETADKSIFEKATTQNHTQVKHLLAKGTSFAAIPA